MRKTALVSLLAVALLLVAAVPSDAGGRWHGRGHRFHSRVFIGVGPALVVAPWWYYPAPYYMYSPPPVIVEQPPPVYVQQQPAPPAVPPAESYWYYCPNARAYYPDAATCPEPWVKVPARAQ